MSRPENTPVVPPHVYRIVIPNPYSGEGTNCYFIDGSPPTLIDTGVATEEAYTKLCASLAELGRRVEDIARIVLTHGHADHRALAPRIRRESGAEVMCHELEAGRVTVVSASQEEFHRKSSMELFRLMGVPDGLLPPLVEGPSDPSINPRLDRVSFVSEGDEIGIGEITLRVLHTPGHSSGSICLYDEQKEILFCGDTLIARSHITALLETDMVVKHPKYNGIKLHAENLQRLLHLGVTRMLPGHGPVIDEYESIVTALLERHRKRRRHILRSLRNGPRSLYQICRSTFPFVPFDDLYLALGEVAGNLGILVEEGRVAARREDELIFYEKT
jgi:glyoxylase-like metal-dependent hydrolase (beta-lactamase superfamily II)